MATPPAESADPDSPSGADAARDAELAKKAAEVVDAFFNAAPRLTPDGKRVVFTSNRHGLPQLYAAELDKPEATRLVTSKERVGGFRITPDGKAIVFVSDKGADENYSIFRVGIDGKGAAELTPGETLHRDLPFIPDKAPDLLVYSARAAKETSTRITVLKAGSSPKVAYTDPGGGGLADVSNDGKQALFVRVLSPSDTLVLLVDLEKGSAKRLYPAEGKSARVHDASFSADSSRIFLSTNGGEEKALLLALDAKTGDEKGRYVEDKPATADITGVLVSKQGDSIGLHVSAGNRDEIRILDAKSLKVKAKSSDALGSGTLTDFSPDGKYLLGTWSTPAAPNEVVRFSTSDGKVEPLRKEARPTLAALSPVEASIATIAAFDGGKIPVNLYLPPAAARAKPMPVLVIVHGGPAASSKIGWDANIRFFSSQGYAIVQPNIRGSTGFGRGYEMGDNGKKRLDALKDLESVAKWSQTQPWADPKRLIVYGGSYGGYMVLMALTRQQSLWRAGVDLVGVSNWRSFMASTTGMIRNVLSKEFGSVEQDGEFLDSISPLKDVATITAPLFVYQGENDPRVPRPESDQVVRSLRSRGVPVEYMVAPNEGHSLDRRENRIAFMSRTARFLEKQLAAAKPDAAKPTAAKPDAAKPDAAKPDAAKPKVAKPDAAKPDAAKPDAAKPDAAKPKVAKPDAAKPDAAKPGAAKPDAAKPDAAKPDAAKPGGK